MPFLPRHMQQIHELVHPERYSQPHRVQSSVLQNLHHLLLVFWLLDLECFRLLHATSILWNPALVALQLTRGTLQVFLNLGVTTKAVV